MAAFECWTKLPLVSKIFLISIICGASTLILGFSTPFWISVDVPEEAAKGVQFPNDEKNREVFYEVFLKNDHHFGLWQWCLGTSGCIDLSLVVKFAELAEGNPDSNNVDIKQVEKMVGYWIAIRVFCTFGFIGGLIVAIVTLVYIFVFKGQKGRSLAFLTIGSYVTGGLLIIAVAIFLGRVSGFLNQFIYLNFSFAMICIATIIYLINGIYATIILCRCAGDSVRVPQSDNY